LLCVCKKLIKMIQNIWDNIKLVRRIKRGHWVKTKHRGWITAACYNDYLSYAFDPVFIKVTHNGWVYM
jgi:hypothetical protein